MEASVQEGSTPAASQVERILEAAQVCFGRGGYAGTSMRSIAEEARVSKSLVHYHFQSKEHLFLEVLVRAYDQLSREVTEALGEQGTPTERALFALDALHRVIRDTPFLQVQSEVWARSLGNERLRVHAQRLRELLRAELLRAMERILGASTKRMAVSLEAAADLLWATITGLGLSAAADPPEQVDAAFDAFRNLVVLALVEVERA